MNERHFEIICNTVRPILGISEPALAALVRAAWEPEDDDGLNLVAWVAMARAVRREVNMRRDK